MVAGGKVAGEAAGGFLKKIVGELIRPAAKTVAKDAAKDTEKAVAKDAARTVTKDVTKDVAKDTAKDTEKAVAKDAGKAIPTPKEGMPVYRVYGEAQDSIGGLERGSRPFGESWTPVRPDEMTNYRSAAGLPNENPGRFMIEGRLTDPSAVREVRPALPLDGNPGGWPEYLITDSERAVDVTHVGGVNEPWTYGPGEWAPE